MLWMSTDQQQRAQNNLERVLGLAAIAFCPRNCHEVGGRLVLYTERISTRDEEYQTGFKSC